MVDLSKLSPFIKWIFFGLSIGVFVWVTMYITKSFKSQCSAGYVFSKQYNKCIQQCGEGQTYYPTVEACRKCDPDKQQEIDGVCKDKCPADDFDHCGSVCYRPQDGVCYDAGQSKVCPKTAYYDKKYLDLNTTDPKNNTYDLKSRTISVKFNNNNMNEWNKINKGDTIVMNNEVGYTATIQDIQQNNGKIILNCKTGTGTGTGTGTADTSCDSPIDSTLTNISSIYVVGKFCCEKDDKGNDQQYDSKTNSCVACQGDVCNGKCLAQGLRCMSDGTICDARDVLGDVCCKDSNRKCGEICCPENLTCVTDDTNPMRGRCAVSCGVDDKNKPVYCDDNISFCATIPDPNQDPNTTNPRTIQKCLTKNCEWRQIVYDPAQVNENPICKSTSTDGTGTKYYYCQVGDSGTNYVRKATTNACKYPRTVINGKEICDTNLANLTQTKCNSADCVSRLAAFAKVDTKYSQDGTCSADFNCENLLPDCGRLTNTPQGINDYGVCYQGGNRTGQYCPTGSCVDGNCGTYYCNTGKGECEFKADDFGGYPSLADCKKVTCTNKCVKCGAGCKLSDGYSVTCPNNSTCSLSTDWSYVTCGGCPPPPNIPSDAPVSQINNDSCEVCVNTYKPSNCSGGIQFDKKYCCNGITTYNCCSSPLGTTVKRCTGCA